MMTHHSSLIWLGCQIVNSTCRHAFDCCSIGGHTAFTPLQRYTNSTLESSSMHNMNMTTLVAQRPPSSTKGKYVAQGFHYCEGGAFQGRCLFQEVKRAEHHPPSNIIHHHPAESFIQHCQTKGGRLGYARILSHLHCALYPQGNTTRCRPWLDQVRRCFFLYLRWKVCGYWQEERCEVCRIGSRI